METIHGVDFQPLEFDRRGALKSGADELAAHVTSRNVSDVVLICHGFRNDANDARRLYTRFLETFADNRTHASLKAKLAGRTFAIGGVFWPSMVFPEPDDGDGAGLSAADAPAADRARLESMKAGLTPRRRRRSTTCWRAWDKHPPIPMRGARWPASCSTSCVTFRSTTRTKCTARSPRSRPMSCARR